MRTLSLAALCAAAVLGGAAVAHTADAAAHQSHTSHGKAGTPGVSHTSHAKSGAAATSGSSGGSNANGANGSSANSPGISTGNGLIGCSTVDSLPLVPQLPLPSLPDPTAVVGNLPDPTGLVHTLTGSALNHPIANMSPLSILDIVTSSACP